MLDEPLVLGVGADQAPRHPGADRFALGARGDQAQDEVAQQVPPVGLDPCVERLGGLGDGSADAAASRGSRPR